MSMGMISLPMEMGAFAYLIAGADTSDKSKSFSSIRLDLTGN